MPRREASRTKLGFGSWMSRMTGQKASWTIFSMSSSACWELSPSPTRATSGRSLAVTGPTSSTSISLAISTRRCSVSRPVIPSRTTRVHGGFDMVVVSACVPPHAPGERVIRPQRPVGQNGRPIQVGGPLSWQEPSMSLSDTDVAREAGIEARIEAAFDQAEAHDLAGHLEYALESLSEAEDLAGGLPDEYIELRECWIASLAPLAVVVRR